MNDRSFRIALVGCGRISKNHFDAIGASTDCRSSPSATSTPSGRAPRAKSSACRGSVVRRDARGGAVRRRRDLHAVRAALRAGRGRRARGKACRDREADGDLASAADDLVHACDEAGVQLFVVKQNRLNPPIQLLKRAVDKGRFGRIYMANVTVRWPRPQEYYDAAPWRGTWEFDGGAIMNQASHYVDLMQWLVGPVESVMAKTATLARRIETEDSGIGMLKFRSGALGVIEVNVLTYPRNLEGSITILGEKGTVKIGGTAVNRVEHWQFADYDDDDKLDRGGEHEPADRLRVRARGLLPQRARGAAGRGEARHRRPGGAEVARADPGDLRVGENGARGAAPARKTSG